jgi:type I restriction enzyme, S subunit
MKVLEFSDVFEDITSKFHKIKKEDYLTKGSFPIIDQGQTYIGGFSNDEKLISGKNLPVVIFGDHTKKFKYVDFPFTIGADGVKVLSLRNRTYCTKYFYYYLRTLKLPESGYSRHFKFLKNTRLPIPERIEDQFLHSDILTKAESLISQRKESIRLLDEFLKSTFLEMFGDPVRNEKKWPIIKFEDAATNENSKRVPIKQADRDEREGIYPYYGATGIIDTINEYRFDGKYLLIAEDGKNLYFRRNNNAFLAQGKFWVNNHAHVLSENGIFRLRYLQFFLNSIDFSPYLTGIDQIKLNRENLEKIPVPRPAIENQNKFMEIVEKTEVLKAQYKKSLQELENLYSSLSQKAFKGDLREL